MNQETKVGTRIPEDLRRSFEAEAANRGIRKQLLAKVRFQEVVKGGMAMRASPA